MALEFFPAPPVSNSRKGTIDYGAIAKELMDNSGMWACIHRESTSADYTRKILTTLDPKFSVVERRIKDKTSKVSVWACYDSQ